jgi:hypothetical protein
MSVTVTFLLKVLAGGPLTVKDIDRQALETALLPEGKSVSQSKPWRTARNKLGIKPRQKDGQWWWELPAEKRASPLSKRASGRACEGAPGNGRGPTEVRGGHVGGPVADEIRVATEVVRNPGGSKPGERRGGRPPGTPNKATAIVTAAMDAISANPDLTPLEFMLGVVRAPNVDPAMRLRAAQAAAPYVHARLVTASGDPAERAKSIVDEIATADPEERARFERVGKRISELDGLRRFVANDGYMPPLTPAERGELQQLQAEYAAAPAYLKVPEPGSAAAFLAQSPNFGALTAPPAHSERFEEPADRRQRLLAERQPVVEAKGAVLQDEPETAPEPVFDDDYDDNGQN